MEGLEGIPWRTHDLYAYSLKRCTFSIIPTDLWAMDDKAYIECSVDW